VLFPDMPQGDSEANELSWQARQPLNPRNHGAARQTSA
jgi:hypothetical protein